MKSLFITIELNGYELLFAILLSYVEVLFEQPCISLVRLSP